VLPHRRLVAGALARAGIEIDPAGVPRAHYAAVRALDRDHAERIPGAYEDALCRGLGIAREQAPAAARALSVLADRALSHEVLWSEPTPGAVQAIRALRRAGVTVLVVTNSDGRAAENLRDAGVLPATGLDAEDVIDSVVVGCAKPDPRIFEVALDRAGASAAEAVHVGDMLSTDVAGASAVGLAPIHLDPYRICRSSAHRHVRTLAGLWAHVAAPG
jgi:HAD superfamily hydrolase (TIGR01509 family)